MAAAKFVQMAARASLLILAAAVLVATMLIGSSYAKVEVSLAMVLVPERPDEAEVKIVGRVFTVRGENENGDALPWLKKMVKHQLLNNPQTKELLVAAGRVVHPDAEIKFVSGIQASGGEERLPRKYAVPDHRNIPPTVELPEHEHNDSEEHPAAIIMCIQTSCRKLKANEKIAELKDSLIHAYVLVVQPKEEEKPQEEQEGGASGIKAAEQSAPPVHPPPPPPPSSPKHSPHLHDDDDGSKQPHNEEGAGGGEQQPRPPSPTAAAAQSSNPPE